MPKESKERQGDRCFSKSPFSMGLQIKAALIVTFVVITAVVCGSCLYYRAVERVLHQADHRHARQLSRALSLASESDLRDHRGEALDDLMSDLVRYEDVPYAEIVGREGNIISSASREDGVNWRRYTQHPIGAMFTQELGRHAILVVRPIIAREKVWYRERLAGSVRFVIDTTGTQRALAGVKRKITLIAAAVVAGTIPLAYLLVWRVMIRPIRKLAQVTRRLADGDYEARSHIHRGDETGELAFAFDEMADQVASMREQLIRHNEQLEQQVAARTGELSRANDRLREEMREKQEFLQAVSHDLNAPLRNVAGMATMIQMKFGRDLPEEVTARLQRIQCNIDVQSSLLEDLLELSRIKTRPEKRSDVDVGELLQGLADTLEYEIQQRRIELVVREPMPTLHVERNRLRQVFQNLIENAIKYMHRERGGRIEVSWQHREGMDVFCVADNGPGIDVDQREKIFTVFQRGSGAGDKAPGRGVGLAVVRTVASNYNGRAWVESTPGQGAQFCFSLAADLAASPEEVPCG